MFEVSDNGAGMSEDTKRKIFSSFYSTKGSRGTGLGLLVTSKIVVEHGGEISFESEEGVGTTFIDCTSCEPDSDKASAGTQRAGPRQIESDKDGC